MPTAIPSPGSSGLPWSLFAAAALLLAACGGGGSAATGANPIPDPGPNAKVLKGLVRGGQPAVTGSTVTLYQANAGAAPTLLARTTSDGSGNFLLRFNCTAAAGTAGSSGNAASDGLLYAVASGGNPGLSDAAANNGALVMMAALGRCSGLPAFTTLNEVTTAAAAWALNGFTSVSGSAGGLAVTVQASGSNRTGLANAFATAAVLADANTGLIPTSAAGSYVAGSQQKLYTLANALAACVNTSGGSSPQCALLFACATPGASVTGAGSCSGGTGRVPADSFGAALNVVRYPGTVAIAGIYDVAMQNVVFSPALSAAPNDWTLSLNFTGGGLKDPTQVAVDAAGNVWLANYSDAVSAFSPTGAALSPATGYTGGGLHESFGIAIDSAGSVWVTNEETPAGVNSKRGSITRLNGSGQILSGDYVTFGGGLNFPEAITLDAAGNVWVGNYGNSTLSKFAGSAAATPGSALSPDAGYTGGGLSFPQGLALDGSGNIWASNTGSDQLSAFSANGVALSPDSGYTGGGLSVPQSLAIDTGGFVWATNAYGNSLSRFRSDGTPAQANAFTGGGLSKPGGVAVDGAGTVWVTNYGNGTLTALQGSQAAVPGAVLSPATGFVGAGLSKPFNPAIDSAGNLWVSNFGNGSLTQFVGLAAPVRTPMLGLPVAP